MESTNHVDGMDIDGEVQDPSIASDETNWVLPPSQSDKLIDGAIFTCWTSETSTPERLAAFFDRWPPSRTPRSYAYWIIINRLTTTPSNPSQTSLRQPDVAGLVASFQSLTTQNAVTVASLDTISKAHNVVFGKWLIFAKSFEIDAIWGRVVHTICTGRREGQAKVSTRHGDDHVICVYVDDYTDLMEVRELLRVLREAGVFWRIGFKPDSYTHLGIYKGNQWGITPSRYSSTDF